MHKPSNWYDRIEAENGQIVRIVTAEWVDKRHDYKVYSVDVYKEDDSGRSWDQNLYQNMWYGCVVCFPGLPVNNNKSSWYYDMTIAEEEGYRERSRLSSVGWSDDVTEADKELVCLLYPDFRYVLEKYKMSDKWELMEKLRIWILHKEVELLLAAGFEKVAMNGNFWRLSEKNRKAVCLFMRQHPQFKRYSLAEIRAAMRLADPDDYARYLKAISSYYRMNNCRSEVCISYDDYKYLKRQQKKFKSSVAVNRTGSNFDEEIVFNELKNVYIDYIRMLFRSDHNRNDDYWRYPSDIWVFHDRLMEEERVKREAEALAKAERERLRQIAFAKAVKGIEKKFKDFASTIDGYSIFVTADYDEWTKQASELEQCICAAGYYQQMADGKCTIVFIQKDGVPQATAQIMPDGTLGQFYANEHDRENCLPCPEIKAAFEKWRGSVPKSKFKKSKPHKNGKKESAA